MKYEQATWDSSSNSDGKPTKRALKIDDIKELSPFHWGYEFDKVMNERGGFDVIITNPPWEILKPLAKEFFATHSDLVHKNKMRIEDFEKEQTKLLQNAEIREAWLDYQSRFPYQSAYFRAAQQYQNQISTVNGKKQGTDINLYKLFTEQCYNLLRERGQCGIVIPSGIYTDLGAKQLREMLFGHTHITGMFCFENNKLIFEGVHRSYKIVVMTYEKGGQTDTFPAAFMRHDVKELARFPKYGALEMSVELIRRLSPDSLSVMEFKNDMDVKNAEKMLKYPLLGEKPKVRWNFTLTNEFHMTNDSYLFSTMPSPNSWPLYEGKLIHQFTRQFKSSKPRYWIDTEQGRSELLRQEMRRVEIALDELANLQGNISSLTSRQERVAAFLKTLGVAPISQADICIAADAPRLAVRDVARNTDERTLIATILPPGVFTSNTLNYVTPWYFDAEEVLAHPSSVRECYEPTFPAATLAYLCGVLNSFTLDYMLRFKVSAHVNMFYLYQLPVPRLAPDDPRCLAIATRVARLVCVGSEFDELRRELLGDVNAYVATDEFERRQIQCEIDGLVAHLYGLTEEEFKDILATFPQVEQPIKDAAIEAFNRFALEPDDLNIAELIEKGEGDKVEFKVAACWNAKKNSKDNEMKDKVVQEVAAFLNTEGGYVLIGVEDDKTIVGLEDDYKAANPQRQNRDAYQLFLSNTLSADLGGDATMFYKISFHTIRGEDVCCIHVQPSTEGPVLVKNNEFYVRNGNSKLKLNMKDAISYQKRRWG